MIDKYVELCMPQNEWANETGRVWLANMSNFKCHKMNEQQIYHLVIQPP